MDWLQHCIFILSTKCVTNLVHHYMMLKIGEDVTRLVFTLQAMCGLVRSIGEDVKTNYCS